ncbi:MAG: hypothetical protein MI717_04100 [Spirochaetales bacterium]|nr:hypothetical protein [Spirochaetales bacterium]
MPEKIHYDDNIYFLTALIRALNDAVRLNVDADYFADKVLEDSLFVDASIQKMHTSVNENPHLIRRNSYLHSLMKLKKAYCRLVEDLLAVEGAFAASFAPMRPRLRRIAAGHLNDVKTIQNRLTEVQETKADRDVTSSDELHYLMSPIEDFSDPS